MYDEQASCGRLWVVLEQGSDDLAGFLLYGGRFPHIKVTQLAITATNRGKGLGKFLIEKLKKHAEQESYLTIKARVASELAANAFWEKQGFSLARQVKGGESRHRRINVRLWENPTASLFKSDYFEKGGRFHEDRRCPIPNWSHPDRCRLCSRPKRFL